MRIPIAMAVTCLTLASCTTKPENPDHLKERPPIAGTVFEAGGRYSITDSLYTEHLEYCSAREWERHDFTFTVLIKNDTLVRTGIEKVESAGVNRLNIERYARIKK